MSTNVSVYNPLFAFEVASEYSLNSQTYKLTGISREFVTM
jgi:hypothetical protein